MRIPAISLKFFEFRTSQCHLPLPSDDQAYPKRAAISCVHRCGPSSWFCSCRPSPGPSCLCRAPLTPEYVTHPHPPLLHHRCFRLPRMVHCLGRPSRVQVKGVCDVLRLARVGERAEHWSEHSPGCSCTHQRYVDTRTWPDLHS
jgi:hypothetical protein